jgi:hypothetical protein
MIDNPFQHIDELTSFCLLVKFQMYAHSERVNSFNYLGYILSYTDDKDMAIKISKFVKVTSLINQVFRPYQEQRHTMLRVYKTLAGPVLAFGSEAWTIRKADDRRLTTDEMRFMRRTAGYSLVEHRMNKYILKELNADPIVCYIQQYRAQWKKRNMLRV